MSGLLLLVLSVSAILVAATLIVKRKQSRPKRIMRERKLLKSEMISLDGEMFYVEKVAFKDWHESLHSFYLISDGLSEGRIVQAICRYRQILPYL